MMYTCINDVDKTYGGLVSQAHLNYATSLAILLGGLPTILLVIRRAP